MLNPSRLLPRLLPFLLILIVTACNDDKSSHAKKEYDPRAMALNDSAVFMFASDTLSRIRALALLDEAVTIDSNYYVAYHNRMIYAAEMRLYDKALASAKALNRIQPELTDHIGAIGVYYELLGDTIHSKPYFQKAIAQYDLILDTAAVDQPNYKIISMSKALMCIMNNESYKANEILHRLYENETNEMYIESIESIMDKSKEDILDSWFQ